MGQRDARQIPSALPFGGDFRYQGTKKWIIGLFMGVVGFILASQFVIICTKNAGRSLELPFEEQKFKALESGDAKYTVLFIGSSRTLRGINPAVFDREAKKFGCQFKSYNFGFHGLSLLEQLHLIERLAQSNQNIKTIVIEPYSVPDRTFDQFISGRRRYFYDWCNIKTVFLDHFTMPNVTGLRRCLKDAIYLAYGFLYERIGVGSLTRIMFPTLPKNKTDNHMKNSNGFIPKDGHIGDKTTSGKLHFIEQVSKFERAQKEAADNEIVLKKMRIRQDLVMQIMDKIRQLKINPVVLIMPQIEFCDTRCLTDSLIKSYRKKIPVLNFNSPSNYPALFKYDNWSDIAHLNLQGSAVMSKLIASELCAIGFED